MNTEVFTRRTRVNVAKGTLFDWHARPGAFERLRPPSTSGALPLLFFGAVGYWSRKTTGRTIVLVTGFEPLRAG